MTRFRKNAFTDDSYAMHLRLIVVSRSMMSPRNSRGDGFKRSAAMKKLTFKLMPLAICLNPKGRSTVQATLKNSEPWSGV